MHQENQAHQDDILLRSTMESPSTGQRNYDTTRVVRTSQIAFIRDRLDQGLSPATVAGLAAVIDRNGVSSSDTTAFYLHHFGVPWVPAIFDDPERNVVGPRLNPPHPR